MSGLLGIAYAAQVRAEDRLVFDIPKQRADLALTEFARQADISVLFPFDEMSRVITNRLAGEYGVEDGLNILLEGTGLSATLEEGRQFIVQVSGSGALGGVNETARRRGRISRDTAAQERSAGRISVLEEVVVTARRVEESLQDVPISISAVTGQEIAQMGIQDTNGVGDLMPNVTLETTQRANQTNIFIRGVGGGDANAAGIQAGVGVYTDGMYMPRIEGGYMSTLDIERIEVLRGPQGTLFGKNTTGGAVNIVTVKPQPESSGSFTLAVGDYDRRDVRGTLNMPLSDTVYARFTGLFESRDGFYTDTLTGMKYGNRRRTAGRAAVRFVPSDELTFDVSATYANQPERPTGATCIWEYEGRYQQRLEADTGEVFQDACNGTLETVGDRSFASDVDMFVDTQMMSVVTETSWTPPAAGGFFDDREIKVIAGVAQQNQEFAAENDFTALRLDFNTRDPIQNTQRSFEVQFNGGNDRVSLVSGLYWADDVMKEDANDCTDELFSIDLAAGEETICANAGFFGAFGYFVNGLPLLKSGTQIYNRIETLALYGNLNFNLTDALSLTVGARQTYEERAFERLQFNGTFTDIEKTFATINEGTVALNTRGKADWDEMTPTLSLGYALSGAGALDSGNLYFTYAKGFLSGGFNTEFAREDLGSSFVYDPETVDSYEIGFKSTWAGGRVRLNLAYFQADYNDKQVESVIPNTGQFAPGTANLQLVSNAATVEADGVELDLSLAPVDGLLIQLAYGTLDTKYKEFISFDPTLGMTVDNSNRRTSSLNPDDSGSLRLSYDIGLANGGMLTPRLIGSYRGDLDRYVNALVTDPPSTVFQKAYTRWDARLSWTNAEGSMTVTGFIMNLTDEEYLTGGSLLRDGNRGWSQIVLGAPRTSGIELRMDF